MSHFGVSRNGSVLRLLSFAASLVVTDNGRSAVLVNHGG